MLRKRFGQAGGGQRMAAVLGHQLLTESGCAALHAEPIERKMTIMDNASPGWPCAFDDADGAKGPLEAGMNAADGFYGWMGLVAHLSVASAKRIVLPMCLLR